METKKIENLTELAYNNLCWDIGCLNGETKKFNVHMFLASIISVIGANAVTTLNNFEDDWVTRAIKMIPSILIMTQTYKLGKDARQSLESKYYLQLLCEKLEKKEIYINLEDFKKAVFKPAAFKEKYFLQDVLLGKEMTLMFEQNGEIKYVDMKKNIEITDEVAECCLGKANFIEYKKNKMRK